MRNENLLILLAIAFFAYFLLKRKTTNTQNEVSQQPIIEQFEKCEQPNFSAKLNCYDGQFMLPVDEGKIIIFGQESCEVMKLQKILNTIDTNNILAVDGSFGCNTLEKAQNILGSIENQFTINQFIK